MILQQLQKKDVYIGYADATRYKYLGYIGRGGYGMVYSAIDTHTNEKVAIKILKDVFRDVPRAIQFLREVKLLRLLKHQNIVEIKSILVPPRSDYFNEVSVVFELMDFNLYDVIRLDDNLTAEDHRWLMFQILCAMKFMHEANVYHLDLKPDNILVNTDLLTKVCDLGLSRVAFREPSAVWRYKGYVVAEPYRAPEISGLNNSKYPYAVDIWSIGCIFAEILTRKQLFPRTSLVHQLNLITDLLGTPSADTISGISSDRARKYLREMRIKSPVPFAVKFPNSDPLALQLLQKLLAFDPKDRPTAEQALAHKYFRGLQNAQSKASQLIKKQEFAFERCKSVTAIRKLMYHEILEHHHPQLLRNYISQVPVCYVKIYYDPARRCYYYYHTMPLVRGGTSRPVTAQVRQDIFFQGPMTGEAYIQRRVTNAIQGNVLNTQWPSLCEPTARPQPVHLPYTYSSIVTGEFVPAPVQRPRLLNESSSRNVTGGFIQAHVQRPRLVHESSSRNVTGESVPYEVPPRPLFPCNASRPTMQENQDESVIEVGREVRESGGRNVSGVSAQNQVPRRPLIPSNASKPSMQVNQEKSVTEERNRESSLLGQLQDLNIKPDERNEDKQCSGLGQPHGSSSRFVTRESVRNQVTPQLVYPSNASAVKDWHGSESSECCNRR
ncbi:hypothetical protein ACET3Z_018399 [Daucus carota]